jgi:hypothetical protein
MKVDQKGASFTHPTTSTTILSSHKIPNAVSPYQMCALLLTFNEVAKYTEFGPHHGSRSNHRSPKTCAKKIREPNSVDGSKIVSRWSGPSSPNPKVECRLIYDRG